MFTNIVVGIDGREGGREAMALARRLASDTARVSLAHVYGEGVLARSSGIPLEVQREDAMDLLERDGKSGWPEAGHTPVFASSVGRGLHEQAAELGADLIVVGSCRRGLVGRVLLGDDTRSAFNGAPCAIAISPRGYVPRSERLAVVTVGYNGSPESEFALATAREIAAPSGALVKVLWVLGPREVHERAFLPADWPRMAEEMVEQTQGLLDAMEDVDGVAVYGGPREELIRLSAVGDLLILGSRGYGPLGSVLHGSVSSYVERHAECPLLVVPRGATRRGVPEHAGGEAIVLGV